MLTLEQRNAFELFNEKAKLLRKSRFVRQFRTRGLNISEHWKEGERFKIKRSGPDDDAIAALVLTLRFFIQDREPCAIQNLAKIYTNLTHPRGVAKEFADARQTLNDFLDHSIGPMKIFVGKQEILRRDLLEITIYGNLSHANPEKRKKFNVLFRAQFFYSHVLTEFILILANFIRTVSYIEKLNQKVLKANSAK